MNFQVEIEKNQTPYTVTKLNTVHTGVFTFQQNKYDRNVSAANEKASYLDDQEKLIDKGSW